MDLCHFPIFYLWIMFFSLQMVVKALKEIMDLFSSTIGIVLNELKSYVLL